MYWSCQPESEVIVHLFSHARHRHGLVNIEKINHR